MSTPTRFTGGLTQSAEFQPLGELGFPDPFYYALFADDFLPFRAGDYTITAAGGSVAATANGGTGGRILFTTGAVGGNFAEIQQPTANFAHVPGAKLAFLTRLNMADVTNTQIIAGLINTTTTPLAPADGIYFQKGVGNTNITLTAVAGGVAVGQVTVPNLPNNGFLNGADIDLGFVVDENEDINIFVGYHLVGNKPNQNRTLLGPVAKLRASARTGALSILPVNPTIAIVAGTAAAQTGNCDFILAAQER